MKIERMKTVFHRCLFGHLKLSLGLSLGTYEDTPAFFHYNTKTVCVGWKLAEQNAWACLQLSAASPLTPWLLGCWEAWLQFKLIFNSDNICSPDTFQTEPSPIICPFFVNLLPAVPFIHLNWRKGRRQLLLACTSGNKCLFYLECYILTECQQ